MIKTPTGEQRCSWIIRPVAGSNGLTLEGEMKIVNGQTCAGAPFLAAFARSGIPHSLARPTRIVSLEVGLHLIWGHAKGLIRRTMIVICE